MTFKVKLVIQHDTEIQTEAESAAEAKTKALADLTLADGQRIASCNVRPIQTPPQQ